MLVLCTQFPEHGIGRYGVELPIMPVDFLFLRRVVEVLESDLLPLDDSGVEVVYDQDKKARKSKGLSQRKVADMADIEVRTVMHIENYGTTPKWQHFMH